MPNNNITLKCIALSLGLTGVYADMTKSISAHGYMLNPMARQAFCETQQGYWWPEDGSNIPNAACRAAFLDSGFFQFVQAPEFSINTQDFTNLAAVQANIVDGTLCAGGDNMKKGMDLPSPFWQRSEVIPNANGDINIKYLANTPHNPSYWEFYLSNPSYDGNTMPLKWSDLTLIQSHQNIDFIKDDQDRRLYEMTVAIPADRVGDAVLYSRWQRDDAAGEGFYNCSDITIVRDTVTPETWFSAGFYLKQGQNASIGETVTVRLFDATGQELINQQLTITNANQATWQGDLAQSLNVDFSYLINIGVNDTANNINFDNNNLLSNIVHVTNKDFTFALSIQPAAVNTAPIINDLPAVSIEELSTITIHAHAFDDEQTTLNYSWQVPDQLSFSAEGANITITAPAVTINTDFTITVVVSDGTLSSDKSFTLTVSDTSDDNGGDNSGGGDNNDGGSDIPDWDSNATYSANDEVIYQGKTYIAKWWNTNQQPNNSSAWQLQSNTDDDIPVWQANNAYTQGTIVSYQQNLYQAKWWTRGEQPDSSAVWQKQ